MMTCPRAAAQVRPGPCPLPPLHRGGVHDVVGGLPDVVVGGLHDVVGGPQWSRRSRRVSCRAPGRGRSVLHRCCW
eukprot:1617654-Pyramimonas_sp.AAC.2